VRNAALGMGELVELTIQERLHFFACAVDGLIDVRGVVRGVNRIETGEADFDAAAFIVVAPFGAIRIVQMNFDAGDSFGKAREGILNDALHISGQAFAALNVIVRVDLNQHQNTRVKWSVRGRNFIGKLFIA
jgi:hypothetical protein